MQRVTRATAVGVMPAVPVSPGTPGFFTGGNPLLGEPATVPGYEWFNAIQEELIAGLVEYLGLAPSAADNTQIRKALSRWFGGAFRTVTATTTLTADDAGVLLLDASGGARTATLPLANSANGRPIRLVLPRVDTSANVQNLLPQGADTLNGLTGNCALPVGATVTLLSDGVSAWRLVAAAGLYAVSSLAVSGNFTVPWWARKARATAIGAGGGGGGTGVANSGGGGGGAGGASVRTLPVVPGATIAATIGALGAGTSSAGGNGGTTSITGFCSASGGQGGAANASSGAGGGGGIGSGGDLNFQGYTGMDGGFGTPMAGAGGTPPIIGGGGGRGGVITGVTGSNGGGGGGGYLISAGTATGGNGGAGLAIMEFMP